jgi:dipeptidyl aminopeptidase/acylaminoacyl peptidase
MIRLMLTVSACAVAVLPFGVGAQQVSSRPLTVSWIMRGPELVGREPSNVRWTPDGEWIHFSWLPPGTDWREPLRPYRVRARPGAVPEELTPAQADSLAPLVADGPVTSDRRLRAVAVQGDLWLVPLPTGVPRRLTETPGVAESPLRFDQSGRTLFVRQELNLVALDLVGGGLRQLTDIRPGPAPGDERPPAGQRAFLADEERRLLAAVRDRLARDSVNRAERERRDASRPRPLYLGRDERVVALDPSPAGTHALVLLATSPTGTSTQVPAYVTPTGYTEQLTARAKVGDAQTRSRMGLITLGPGGGEVQWLAPDPSDTTAQTFGDLRLLGWNDAGTAALVWVVTRDYTHRYLRLVDARVGTIATLDLLVDTAWVGGPCFGCAGWLPGEQGVYFVSEADGWAHLYTMRADGTQRRQLTRGAWEVLAVSLSPDRSEFRLHTSEPSVYERHYYTMPITGGRATRLTGPVGGHEVTASPDGRWLAVVYSAANRPPELFLQAARPGATWSQLTVSPTAEWLAFPWIQPEIIEIPASDGVRVPARIYRPADVGATPNGAAVIFVHGAGYLHNVHRYWSSYYREYMFHHLLAQRGYIVLDLDYRASAGYGRDWRTAIYRHMGGRDLADHVDAARYLQREFGIPPARIGIYGGSYGGFITLMALFTAPQWFGAGAALRPVTDWAHYNHPYTARILNQPQDDGEAYRRSSPIHLAEGLRAPLLIAHGMVDVNVHFQDVVRLVQRLIELGKERWELAVYPVEDHGFVRPDSWTDQYRRILELFERALR